MAVSTVTESLRHRIYRKSLEYFRTRMVCERHEFVHQRNWYQCVVVHVAAKLLEICENHVDVLEVRALRFQKRVARWYSHNVNAGSLALEDDLCTVVGGSPVR